MGLWNMHWASEFRIPFRERQLYLDADALTEHPCQRDIVNNYRNYYRLYMKYALGAMISDDTAAIYTLAHLCPLTDGAIISEAQGLNGLLTGNYGPYLDCNGGQPNAARTAHNAGGTPSLAAIEAIAAQQYTLAPNPSNGTMQLMQQVAEDAAGVKVWNVTGELVYNLQVHFANKSAVLQLDALNNGVYLIEITGTDGHKCNQKFVITK